MKTKITLKNDFHGSSVTLVLQHDEQGYGTLSKSQVKRANSALCRRGCTCSGSGGIRGYQHWIDTHMTNQDGSMDVHLRGW